MALATATLRVHLDAFRIAPAAYAAATWWRIRGKRVRSKARFSMLLSRSPNAYRLWLLRRRALPPPVPSASEKVAIVALVDARGEADALRRTVGSLRAEGIPYYVVGDARHPTVAHALREIAWEAQPWLLPIMAGDRLADGAVAAYRAAIPACAAGVLYADDDLVTRAGKRRSPHFKPQWNAELFEHFDFLTGACVLRLDPAAVDRLCLDGDWAAGLVRAALAGGGASHLPRILHHRHARPAPCRPAPIVGSVREMPPVSVVIPTRNRHDLLKTCLEGLSRTAYPDIDVILVDNDSDDPDTHAFLAAIACDGVRVLHHPGPFNYSAINNRAVRETRGTMLCLLNNDIEILAPNWLQHLVVQALRDEVGAVGAQLHYPDGRIQHAGVVLGICGGAAHAHRLVRPEGEGYFHRHALPQFVSAVTAAAMVVQRDRFLAVGGFDEQEFPVAFNDVDLCMRLNRRGWQSLYEPRAQLLHHESVSRGFDRDPAGAARLAREMSALQRRWGTLTYLDPFHHPELSRYSETFVVGL
ncbi:glycosyl transferase [Sphingomonas pokkalii]|uniref:Glycosyl transferase n=1 Tax=Sphingomonas pokkalii TaxID=2175090 RepID=A0A2U0SIY9_9SPHN|nr:glycosyl transferase [Sphingomonas pokkalii]